MKRFSDSELNKLDEYPGETLGSVAARENREASNQLSDLEREKNFEFAMRLVYGDGDKTLCGRY